VNLYDDEKNTELVKEKVRITKIDLKSDGTLEMDLSGFMSGDLIFNCQKPGELMLDKALGKDNVLYNKNLTSSLQKDFCTKSSGNVMYLKQTLHLQTDHQVKTSHNYKTN
jgi:hypothetical protein